LSEMNVFIAYPVFPEPDTNSGSYRVMEIIRILRGEGIGVTVLATDDNGPRYRAALEALGVRCVAYRADGLADSADRFGALLRSEAFDVAVLVHYYVFRDYVDAVRAFLPDCRLVLDTMDLHYVRRQRKAELSGEPADQAAAEAERSLELEACTWADQIWVVTDAERRTLAAGGCTRPVEVIPNIHRLAPDLPGYDQRRGVAFLGGYRHKPNIDAVHFLIQEVLPELRRRLPDVPVLVAGSAAPDEIRRYHDPARGVEVVGWVDDHVRFLSSARVGVAPLRFGAGMKGKVGEYFSCGLPCVTTGVGAEGMDLVDGETALIADDPAGFAAAVARLYTDPTTWRSVSAAGVRYIAERLSPAAVAPRVLRAVRGAAAAPRAFAAPGMRRKAAALLNPRRWAGLSANAWAALWHGGPRELAAQIKVWLRRAY
jgi:O-antigen biosynthesis protein